jgi:hypothetical protein
VVAAAPGCSRPQALSPPLPAPLSLEADSVFRVPCELLVRRAAAAGRHIYRESEVTEHAELARDDRRPAYPNERTEAVPAAISVEFVVDSAGVADMATFRPVETAPKEFLMSIRDFLSSARFTPAHVAGRSVSQCVKQTFQFVPTYYHRVGAH